jgi:hypothetical protein
MKSRMLACVTAMTLLAALVVPVRLAAQIPATGLASLPLDAQASISAQLAKLTTSDGAAFDYSGYSVASGDTVVVGAPLATIGSNIVQGAAYVFVKPASGWADMTQAAKLTASDGGVRDTFGLSVSISGNTVVAGAF